MFKRLRNKIEAKRNSKNIFWKSLVFGKDFIFKSTMECRRILKNVKIIIKLRNIGPAPIPHIPNEIRMFMVVKNESLRLPYIFKYYSDMGVNRFFIIDNGSTDGTTSFLLSQHNTHVFRIDEDYNKYNTGTDWIMFLLKKYGKGHWCLVVDADEIFIYPHYEKVSLRELCNFLDKESSTASGSMLLEMYSDKPIRAVKYKNGENPILTCPYFDKDSHYAVEKPIPEYGNILQYKGGMRERAFGISATLNKVPIFKFKEGTIIVIGQHFIIGGALSNIKGAVLHFKYMSNFISEILKADERKIWPCPFVKSGYKRAKEIITKNPDFSLYYSGSVKFEDSVQLVTLKIMETSEKFELYAAKTKN